MGESSLASFEVLLSGISNCWKVYSRSFQSGPNWFPIFQIAQQWIHPCDQYRFTLILDWERTDSQTFEYHSHWIEDKERVFEMDQQQISPYQYLDSDWFPLMEERLPSLWIYFSGYQKYGKGHFKCVNLGLNWFLTIPDSTPMNPPQFPSGFPINLYWGRGESQPIYSNSQWIKVMESSISGVPNRVPTDVGCATVTLHCLSAVHRVQTVHTALELYVLP